VCRKDKLSATRPKKEKSDLEKLASLGPERLAKMLLERADWDEGTARNVEQAFAESDPLRAVVGKIKKSLAQYTESRIAGAWKKSSIVSEELEHQRIMIVESVLPRSPETAAGLLELMIDRHVPIFNNVDDSSGALSEVFREAVYDWGIACAKNCDRVANRLAGIVYKKITSNSYGVYDHIVPAFSEALGEPGLAELEKMLRKELSLILPAQKEEKYGRTDENWSRRLPLCHALEEIADLRSDPDAYIVAVSILGRPAVYAREIAERLMKSARFDEALEWLDNYDGPYRSEAVDLKGRCLIAAGKKEEAKELLWTVFLQTLSSSCYTGALELASDEEAEKKKQAAIETAGSCSSALTGLSFLLGQGFVSAAAAVVVNRTSDLDGAHYHVLRPAAEKLERDFPLSALLLRRRLVDAALEKGQTKYYGYAVSDLKHADLLSRLVTDWGDIEDQKQYLARLWAKHGRKSSFWSRY
jgi:hypothetical protein